ncbi:MAG: hypothetical protein ACM3JG_13870 [Thiohalocapsa sp.]
MATDADKIAAATLAATFATIGGLGPDTSKRQDRLIELYGDILAKIVHINPDTGRQFTQEELQRRRILPRP